jgi:hypothetical protein
MLQQIVEKRIRAVEAMATTRRDVPFLMALWTARRAGEAVWLDALATSVAGSYV